LWKVPNVGIEGLGVPVRVRSTWLLLLLLYYVHDQALIMGGFVGEYTPAKGR